MDAEIYKGGSNKKTIMIARIACEIFCRTRPNLINHASCVRNGLKEVLELTSSTTTTEGKSLKSLLLGLVL